MKINIEFELEFLKEMLKGILEAESVCDSQGIGPDFEPYIERLITEVEKYCPEYAKELLDDYNYLYVVKEIVKRTNLIHANKQETADL